MKHWSPLEMTYLVQGVMTRTPYKAMATTLARSPKAIEVKVRRMKHNLVRHMHLRDIIGLWTLIHAPQVDPVEYTGNVQ